MRPRFSTRNEKFSPDPRLDCFNYKELKSFNSKRRHFLKEINHDGARHRIDLPDGATVVLEGPDDQSVHDDLTIKIAIEESVQQNSDASKVM